MLNLIPKIVIGIARNNTTLRKTQSNFQIVSGFGQKMEAKEWHDIYGICQQQSKH